MNYFIYPPQKKVVEGEEIHIQVLVCTQSESEVFCVRAKLNFEEFCKYSGLNAKVLEKKSRRFNKKKYLYCNKIAKAVKTRHFHLQNRKKNEVKQKQ